MKLHINITVVGKVQGVWFRAKTKEKAVELGVKGFVKNMENGCVFIEAEGTEEQLKDFIEWCKKGPQLATVKELIQEPGSLTNFSSFEIR